MRRILPILTLIALLLSGMTTISADSPDQPPPPRDGCADSIRPTLDAATDRFDFNATCDIYRQCIQAQPDANICVMRTVFDMTATCADDDPACWATAYLLTGAISLFEFPEFSMVPMDPPPELPGAVAAAVQALETGNVQAASEAIARSGETYPHPMIAFSQGVMAELSGEDNEALAFYRAALDLNYADALTYFVRGSLYSAQGETANAGIDFRMVQELTGDQPDRTLLDAVGDLVETHPVDFEQGLTFDYLPLLAESFGPGGSFFYDLSGESSLTVRGLLLDGGTRLALRFEPDEMAQQSGPTFPDIVLLDGDGSAYERTMTYFYQETERYMAIDLETGEGSDTFLFFEGLLTENFILAEPGANDTRMDLPRCDGGLFFRLVIGEFGEPAGFFNEVFVYDAPGGEAAGATLVDGNPGFFTVLDGPDCQPDGAWWRVETSNGIAGWLRENTDATSYAVNPSPDGPGG